MMRASWSSLMASTAWAATSHSCRRSLMICQKYGARLLVDDAHGIGVAGGGRGTSAHFGLTDQVDLIMGTFSKSFASIGGFIAGSADVIHYVQHHARSLIFSAALPAPNLAAVLAALDIIENEPNHVHQVWKNAEYMRNGLKANWAMIHSTARLR